MQKVVGDFMIEASWRAATPGPLRSTLKMDVRAVRLLALLALLQLGTGCAIVIDGDQNTRDYYIIGFARLRVPEIPGKEGAAHGVEITGMGVAVSDFFQLGYFKEFRAHLRPETNSAVVVIHTDSEAEHLKTMLKKLNKEGLCLVIRELR